MFGSWTCTTCNLGGCWPARNQCFRCLAARPSEGTPPAGNHRPQRERHPLGRAPQRSPAVEPAQRGPLAPTCGSPSSGAPRVVPRATANAGTQAVLKALRGLGLSEDLVGQVANSLQPPVGNKVSSRERQMAHLRGQLHHLRVRIARQVEALRVHNEQSQLMVSKFNAFYEEEASMHVQYRDFVAMKLTPSSSPARSPAVSVVGHDDPQWANQCEDVDADMEQDGGLEGGLTPPGQPTSPPPSQFRLPPWLKALLCQHGCGHQLC